MTGTLDLSKLNEHRINIDPIEFSQLGDRLFDELAAKMATKKTNRLLFEHKLKTEIFKEIRIAATTYISACLKSPTILSEKEIIARLLEAKDNLPNYTGTGLLMPKREQTLEFNLFQKSIAKAFFQLGGNELIDAVDLPVNLRMIYGNTAPEKMRLPFSSSKLHSDVWAGVHADAVVVVLPIFGDIEHITIEAGEMPREMELPYMRVMSDFDEGRNVPMVVKYTDVQMRHGTMYFNDARGLHQTVRRKNEGLRISVDFRFRRKFNEFYRAMVPPSTGGIEADVSIPYKEWLKYGTEKMLVFDETLEQAKAKQNISGPVPLYARGYRSVELFPSATQS